MNEINSDLKELSKIREYFKGQTKTRDLVPTAKILLGSGAFGDVFVHGKNPNLVVKKSITSQVSDFTIASQLDHPNIVKVHQLFVKCYPWGQKKYKLVMDRIQGDHLYQMFGAKLPPKTVLSLMNQAKECCLYLFDHRIHWGDMHGANTYYDKTTEKLTVADFGFWSQNEPLPQMTAKNIKDAKRLLRNILAVSTLPGIPQQQGFLDATIPQCITDMTDANGKDHAISFRTKTAQEMRATVEDYFDTAIKKFTQALAVPKAFG